MNWFQLEGSALETFYQQNCYLFPEKEVVEVKINDFIQEKYRALDGKPEKFRVDSFCDALNPVMAVNPCPQVYSGMRHTFGIRVDRIAEIPVQSTIYLKLWETFQRFPVIEKKGANVYLEGDSSDAMEKVVEAFDAKRVQKGQKSQKGKVDLVLTNNSAFYSSLRKRSLEFESVFEKDVALVLRHLKKGGNCCLRILAIENLKTMALLWLLRNHFKQLILFKPGTTRVQSDECFIIGLAFRSWKKVPMKRSFLGALTRAKQKILNYQQPLIQEAMRLALLPSMEREVRKKICKNLPFAASWCKKRKIQVKKSYQHIDEKKEHCFSQVGGKKRKKDQPVKKKNKNENKNNTQAVRLDLLDRLMRMPRNERKRTLKRLIKRYGEDRLLFHLDRSRAIDNTRGKNIVNLKHSIRDYDSR